MKLLINIIFLFAIYNNINSQVLVDRNRGDYNQTRKGFMDGNLVETVYYNFGEIADWENETRNGVWPIGSGHTYVDGVAIIVQAETKTPAGKIIHPLETNYYEYTRYDAASGVTYGWWPLPGYAASFNSIPARSDDTESWPLHWPDRPNDWDNTWNGFFGKGVQNADLETFFVFDDHLDREYLLEHDFRPDSEYPDRGGLGMQVKARGFQWSQVLAEDVIFWYYEITNTSTTDYEKTLFAQYVDWGIGGTGSNSGDFNEIEDMSFAWSLLPLGMPGNWSPVGLAGYAFLESPGVPDDNFDNDTDGLSDEKRDNEPDRFIETADQDPFLKDVAQDTIKFKEFYGYSWEPHWDADENANWDSYDDRDNSGTWEPGENLKDDVGTDGIGPFDSDYTGPDLDGTEGNGRPDQGEPDFGFLDKDESDQLGLTGFAIFPAHTYDLNNDENNWKGLSALPSPQDQALEGVNLTNFFSSYLFEMQGRTNANNIDINGVSTGETERFSMSLIFGIDKSDLFRRKRTVQSIYNANYRFALPPDKPTIKVIPGDEEVILYWDNRAELTFDAFYQKYNFEGYRIYRSTEQNFLEIKTITDAYGKATFRKPIAQFDLADGVTGLHPVDVNGAKFNLGEDTGIKHTYIDKDVTNGQTYYYAVSAYDQGYMTTTVEGNFVGIPPSETSTIFKVDINGEITSDINTAVATPRAPAAGYVAPEISNIIRSGPGSGEFSIAVLDPDSVKQLTTYRVEFENEGRYNEDTRPYLRVINYTDNDTVIAKTRFVRDVFSSSVTDGYSIELVNDTLISIDWDNTGWEDGNSNFIVEVGFDSRYAGAYQGKRVFYPADFEITLTEPGQGQLSFPATSFSKPIQSNVLVKNLTEDQDNIQFIFRDNNTNELFDSGDAIFIVYGDSAGTPTNSNKDMRVGWSVSFFRDTTIADEDQIDIEFGDVYKFSTYKPFRTNEYVEFLTKAMNFSQSDAQSDLDKIAVVPNPYAGAASWEPLLNEVGRGERRIQFIHLPNECTIRIYTISGKLVQTLEHNSTLSDGQEPWNLVSKDGMDIAYGVYVFHVDAPGIGEKIGKFAILK